MLRATRTRFIPAGSVKVADKATGAVVYAYQGRNGRPCAIAYTAKATRSTWHFNFRTDAEREKAARRFFDGQRAHAAAVQARRDEAKAWVNDYKAGDILRTCWGYDQTNVEFFEVIEVSGKFVTLREVAQVRSAGDGWTGTAVPQSGSFIGAPLRRRATREGVKIDDVRYGRRWGSRVAGVVVGRPANWSSYA